MFLLIFPCAAHLISLFILLSAHLTCLCLSLFLRAVTLACYAPVCTSSFIHYINHKQHLCSCSTFSPLAIFLQNPLLMFTFSPLVYTLNKPQTAPPLMFTFFTLGYFFTLYTLHKPQTAPLSSTHLHQFVLCLKSVTTRTIFLIYQLIFFYSIIYFSHGVGLFLYLSVQTLVRFLFIYVAVLKSSPSYIKTSYCNIRIYCLNFGFVWFAPSPWLLPLDSTSC